jgi:hypothetical protein
MLPERQSYRLCRSGRAASRHVTCHFHSANATLQHSNRIRRYSLTTIQPFTRITLYSLAPVRLPACHPACLSATIAAFTRTGTYVLATITASQSPRYIFGRHDCGISSATARRRPPRYRHSNHERAYSLATIVAFQVPGRVFDRLEGGIPIATAATRRLRYRHSNRIGAHSLATTRVSNRHGASSLAPREHFHRVMRTYAIGCFQLWYGVRLSPAQRLGVQRRRTARSGKPSSRFQLSKSP